MKKDNIERIKRLVPRPNKALGQNFLVNELAISTIIELVNPAGKVVLEIGPGLGALTFALNETADKLFAVDIDSNMIAALNSMQHEFAHPEALTLVHADFLKFDIDAIQCGQDASICVVGNLPYYITTPICMKLLRCASRIQSMTLMMQAEAAQRFLSKPNSKQYGPLTVLANYMYDINKILELSPHDYYPQPDVDSAVLHLRQKRFEPKLADELDKLLSAAFSMRRKTLCNNLLSRGIDRQTSETMLEKVGVPLNARSESLDVDTFVMLANLAMDAKIY